jgi:hypothetical protein
MDFSLAVNALAQGSGEVKSSELERGAAAPLFLFQE